MNIRIINTFPERLYIVYKDFSARFTYTPKSNLVHLKEAINWIYRAQDATPDGGVSHSYNIGVGWLPSYPETTGYIIPTILNWHKVSGEESSFKRALKMADWEMEVQRPDGSIPSLSTGEPVVFDTGQVLFGMLNIFSATRNKKYLQSAVLAGDWLFDTFDFTNRTWLQFGNPGSSKPNLYNIHFAWALLELSRITGDRKYKSVVEVFLDWVFENEQSNGWFNYNCLSDNQNPLLHTIAYTAQGLLDTGQILNDSRCIDSVIKMSEHLLKNVSNKGRMPGRFDNKWEPTVGWSCLTGMAQLSVVWQRLSQIAGYNGFLIPAYKINKFLRRTQILNTAHTGLLGGIKGSYPVYGKYGSFKILNWATKFFIDAMILEEFEFYNMPT